MFLTWVRVYQSKLRAIWTDGARLMRFSLVVVEVALLVGLPGQASAKTTWKTKVEGTTFRITLDGDVVNVVDKSIFTGRNMDVRDKMRAAVLQATGCEIVDEMWFDAKMKGKFRCPDGQAPRQPAAD